MNSPIRQQDMCDQKPWLTPWEQVSHLKSKGVRFRYMSEAEARVSDEEQQLLSLALVPHRISKGF